MTEKYEFWRNNWPAGIPTCTTFPYGKMPIADYVKKQAEITPGRTAINFYGREVSFKEWDEAADRLATALADFGYKKGDTVVIYMQNSPQLCIAYIAAARLGLIIFTADPGFKEYEMEYEINDSEAKLIFAFDQNYPVVRAIRERAGIRHVIITSFWDYMPAKPSLPLPPIMNTPKQSFDNTLEFLDMLRKYPPEPPNVAIEMDEPELVLYTGGTTGLPKGCVHTHENTLRSGAHAYQVRERGADLSTCDSVIIFGPMGHIGALSYGLFPCCVHGRTMVILARFDPVAVMQAIDEYKIEFIVPTIPVLKAMMEHPSFKEFKLSSIKLWMVGEWMVWLEPEFSRQWGQAKGVPLTKWGYGMSEIANVGIGGTRLGYEVPFKNTFITGAISPDEGIDVRIVDFETRKDLPPGQRGEIVIKSPARCKYYWKKPKETAQALSPEGWFYTGDIGMLDEEGYLYWYGRKKYLIRVSGFQVSPGEVEMIGRNCPDIANIAVAGIQDKNKGEIPKAFVQLVPGSKATATDLENWFRQKISTYKVPLVEVWPELPMTPKGGIDMKKLIGN